MSVETLPITTIKHDDFSARRQSKHWNMEVALNYTSRICNLRLPISFRRFKQMLGSAEALV